MNFNGKEFAKKMRDGKCVDLHGHVVCSLELWERIASIIEDQSDEVDRLLNYMCKVDREQEERIQEEYVPYEQYEELLEENKVLKYKLEETYLSAEGLKMENVKLKEENEQLRAKQTFVAYKGARGSGKRYEIMKHNKDNALTDVKCKDCRFVYHNKQLGTYRCMHFGCVMRPEDYCSWGERSRNEG